MNRLQANLCLVCVTLFWAAEVVVYACIPDGVPEFAADPRLFAGIPFSKSLISSWAVYAYLVVAFVLAGSLAKMLGSGGMPRRLSSTDTTRTNG